MFTVYAEYSIAPVCIDGAHVIETTDFAAWAAERGFTEVQDYSAYGGNTEYHVPGNRASPAFLIKIGEYADRAVADVVRDAVKVAGRSSN